MGVDVVDGDVEAGRLCVGGYAHELQRGEAEVGDEVGVDVHGVRPDQCGNLFHENLLAVGQRTGVCGHGAVRPVLQRRGVYLAVDVERELRDVVPEGGQHIMRQTLCGMTPYLFDVRLERRGVARCRYIRHEMPVARRLLDARVCSPDQRVMLYARRYLRQLYSVAMQLHLRIEASEEVEAAVVVQAYEVAAVIQARRKVARVVEGVVEERPCVEFGQVPVAFGELRAAYHELSRLAWRHTLQVVVEDMAHHSGQGAPYAPPFLFAAEMVGGGDDGALRRSVAVDETERGVSDDALRDAVGYSLAARRHGVHVGEVEVGEEGEQRGRHEAESDVPLHHQPPQQRDVVFLPVGGYCQRGAMI